MSTARGVLGIWLIFPSLARHSDIELGLAKDVSVVKARYILHMCHGQKSQYWGWETSHLLIGILIMGI